MSKYYSIVLWDPKTTELEGDFQDAGGQGSGQSFPKLLSNVLYEFSNPMVSFGLASMGTNRVVSYISQC